MAYHKTKLDRSDVEKILYKLCLAICSTKDTREAAEFIRDLLSHQEAEMIAKRLMIAELILSGESYGDINRKLKVSNGTIARVQEWLKISGDGYRKVIKRTKDIRFSKVNNGKSISEWNSIKKRYPIYFWPQLLLEELIKNSNDRQRKHIRVVMKEIGKSKKKSELFKRINRLMDYGKQK